MSLLWITLNNLSIFWWTNWENAEFPTLGQPILWTSIILFIFNFNYMPTITDKAAPILWPVTNMLAFG
jgi:hypothetical protein